MSVLTGRAVCVCVSGDGEGMEIPNPDRHEFTAKALPKGPIKFQTLAH